MRIDESDKAAGSAADNKETVRRLRRAIMADPIYFLTFVTPLSPSKLSRCGRSISFQIYGEHAIRIEASFLEMELIFIVSHWRFIFSNESDGSLVKETGTGNSEKNFSLSFVLSFTLSLAPAWTLAIRAMMHEYAAVESNEACGNKDASSLNEHNNGIDTRE